MSENQLSPGELYEISGSYWKSCTLHAAVKLGVCTAIGDGALTAVEVAERISASRRGVLMLLSALVAIGILEREGDRYTNTPRARVFLSKSSPEYIGHMILHHRDLVESWAKLHQAVETGKPVKTRAEEDEARRENFLLGMFNLAMGIAPRVAKLVDLKGRRRLLDLGGGPGTYAVHFCMENPELEAIVFDLPATRPFAEATIRRFGVADRVRFASGNYLKGPIEGRYDAVWLSQILHGEGPEDCERLIRKAISVLEPGGMILVHEFLLNDALDGPLFPAIFSLNMLVGTPSGQSYSEGWIREMLTKTGAKEIRRLPFQGPNDSAILAAVV